MVPTLPALLDTTTKPGQGQTFACTYVLLSIDSTLL